MNGPVVVCGAGIAGIATAYHLMVKQGIRQVVFLDPRPPLSLTSDKSTECYRNWWPNRPMVELMNRSIDLMEEMSVESAGAFRLEPRGYLYTTADTNRLQQLESDGAQIAGLGAGELREHTSEDSYRRIGPADGADLFTDGDALRSHFPFLSQDAVGGLHARRAGWFSAQQLGRWMLEQAQDRGARLVKAEVRAIHLTGGRISGVALSDGSEIEAGTFINAAGPMLNQVAAMIGVELPVYSEVHIKVAFRDHLRIVPRDAPMFIWSDPQRIEWSEEERRLLEGQHRDDLLGEMPASCHARPEGGPDSQWLVGLWEYHRIIQEPVWPLPEDPLYPEVVLRGLKTMAPELGRYLDRLPQPVVDGGYYTKTRENRPLIGPLPIAGAYVVGAFSGFGVMAAAAAGELASLHVTGRPLPDYATAFVPARYEDSSYLAEIDQLSDTGQI